jgi:hypothetical protein
MVTKTKNEIMGEILKLKSIKPQTVELKKQIQLLQQQLDSFNS